MAHLFVDSVALSANVARLSAALSAKGTRLIGVVKGNGYGLGLLNMAAALRPAAHMLAVDTLEEARALRQGGETLPLLVLAPLHTAEQVRQLAELGAALLIGNPHLLEVCAAVGREWAPVAAHLMVDSGFGGYGFLPDALPPRHIEGIDWQGIATHFSTAFAGERYTRAQFAKFSAARAAFDPDLFAHCCNSAATLRYPDMWCDAVRCGTLFAGRVGFGYTPVGQLRGSIIATHDLPKGARLGYGSTYTLPRAATIGVVDVGYAHGLGMGKRRDALRLRDAIREARDALMRKPLQAKLPQGTARVVGRVNMHHTCLLVPGGTQVGTQVEFAVNPLMVPAEVPRVTD